MSDRRTPIGLVQATRNMPITGARALVLAAALGLTPAMAIAQSQNEWTNTLDRIENAVGGRSGAANQTPPAQDPANGQPNADSTVKVSEYMTFDIFVRDEDLGTVLEMLSANSQKNIVASRDVVASVTANLYSVTFYEALDAILNVNGYGYIEKGNFIYVYPAAEIQRIKDAQRQIVSRVVTLNYLNANDAALFVQPLLSSVGDIRTNGDVGEFNLPEDRPTGNEEFALSSTLVIYDYPEHVDEIVALVAQLDTRPAQVLVEARILQTQLTEANAFGVDFALVVDVDLSDFSGIGGPLSAIKNLAQTGDTSVTPDNGRGGAIIGTPGNIAGPGTFKAGLIYDDFAVFLRALDEVTDVQVLSNPKILALNRQPARVLVGRKLGYLNTTTTETATTQTVQFLDTGTQLAFRPFISNDGMIRMELRPRVSEGFIRGATDVSGAAVTIPDEVTQEITTNVLVPDGATVVLGGLFRESTTLGRKQVPILGDIPIIGAAFRGHDDETDRSEIIFMIKPTVMNDRVLLEQGSAALGYIERVRAGTRQGLLPWSQTRQTSQLNIQAERMAADGRWNEAMWALRRSLELRPAQPEAIELRERLFNQKNVWPSRSMLERVINGEVDAVTAQKWPERVNDPENPGFHFEERPAPRMPERSRGFVPEGWSSSDSGKPSTSRTRLTEGRAKSDKTTTGHEQGEFLTDEQLAEFEKDMQGFILPDAYETEATGTMTSLPEPPADGAPMRAVPFEEISEAERQQGLVQYGPIDPMEFEWALRQMNAMLSVVAVSLTKPRRVGTGSRSTIVEVDPGSNQ